MLLGSSSSAWQQHVYSRGTGGTLPTFIPCFGKVTWQWINGLPIFGLLYHYIPSIPMPTSKAWFIASCEYVKNWPFQLESSKTPSCKGHQESRVTYPKITSAWTSILIFIFPRLIRLQVFTKPMLYVPTGRMENTQLLPLSANDLNMTMGSWNGRNKRLEYDFIFLQWEVFNTSEYISRNYCIVWNCMCHIVSLYYIFKQRPHQCQR